MHAPGLLFMNLTCVCGEGGGWAINSCSISRLTDILDQNLKTYPLHIAVQTEDVEHPVCIHLCWVQTIHHDHGRLGMGAVLPRWWRGRAILPSIPLVWPTSPRSPHGRAWATTLVVAIIMVPSVVSLWATCSRQIPPVAISMNYKNVYKKNLQ